MPSCFALTKKGEKERASLSKVDDEMRREFGEPPDEVNYLYGWYNSIGLSLALGNSFAETRNKIQEFAAEHPKAAKWLKVVDWLEEHYTVESWRGL